MLTNGASLEITLEGFWDFHFGGKRNIKVSLCPNISISIGNDLAHDQRNVQKKSVNGLLGI